MKLAGLNICIVIYTISQRKVHCIIFSLSCANILNIIRQKVIFLWENYKMRKKNIPQLKCWEVLEKHALLIFHSSPHHILLVVLQTYKSRFISDAHNECTIIKKRMTLNRSSTQSLNEVCSHFMAGSKGKSHSKKKKIWLMWPWFFDTAWVLFHHMNV